MTAPWLLESPICRLRHASGSCHCDTPVCFFFIFCLNQIRENCLQIQVRVKEWITEQYETVTAYNVFPVDFDISREGGW